MSVNHAYRLYHWRYLRQWCIHNSMNDFMKEHIRVTCLTGLNSLNYRLYSRHCHTPNEIRHLPVYQSRFNAIMYDKTRILAHGFPVRAMGRQCGCRAWSTHALSLLCHLRQRVTLGDRVMARPLCFSHVHIRCVASHRWKEWIIHIPMWEMCIEFVDCGW